MPAAVVLLLVGIGLLVGGAELVLRSGTRLAARLGIPPLVIGLTIVALGTSAPELAVGIDAALVDAGSLAVGNIAGTNTVNLLFVLGLSAVIRPIGMDDRSLRIDLPVMVVAASAMLLMAWDGQLSRLDGAVLALGAVVHTVVTVRSTRKESAAVRAEFEEEFGRPVARGAGALAVELGALVAGIAVIVVGADLLVGAAEDLARQLGVSDAVIGLTVVAIGTSAPELVTMIMSTLRDERDIAIGNILGSSTYNILAILGVTALVPAGGIEVEPRLVNVDIPVMLLAALACIPVFVSGRRVTRQEGGLFVGSYLLYLGLLVAAA